MKIYWHGTAPWSPSSYSVLTKRTVPYLVKEGHQVLIGTWYGLNGSPLPWGIDIDGKHYGTVTIMPRYEASDGYNSSVIPAMYKYGQSDVCIAVCDVWVFKPEHTEMVNFCPWFPIDHDPAPPGVIESLQTAIYPMCYSQWGVEVLEGMGVKAHYVPASAPSSTFNYGEKNAAREAWGQFDNDTFLVTMVAANKDPQDRKGFNEALLGFAAFHKRHPNSALYIHTNWDGPVKVGNIAKALGIDEAVYGPDRFAYVMGLFSEAKIANIYRSSDVLLNTAKSEGFGLPIVEAQMCGCPVVATDYGNIDEMFFGGWKVPGLPDWTPGAESFRVRCSIGGVLNALESAKSEANDLLRQETANRATAAYDDNAVFDTYWRPALAEIERLVTLAPKALQTAEVAA